MLDDATDFSKPPTNNGKPWTNKPAVVLYTRRRTDRPKSYGRDMELAGVLFVIFCVAVFVAVFGPSFGMWG